MSQKTFKTTILDYYKKSGRHDLPWRKTRDPYRILVSEVMLQQTQAARILKRYPEFLKLFPTARALAAATSAEVLKAWQGLGYNRRALMLKRTAESVTRDLCGKFPRTSEELESLPGIGQSTRGAIMAFAFGIPTVFIETNIRTVFLHFFFKDKSRVHDRDILKLIDETLDRENPRDWYYALMDYGLHLKQTLPNPSRRSAHHVRQSPFKGSRREVRSRILKIVLASGASGITAKEIARHVGETTHDVTAAIASLTAEGFITETDGRFRA